ncbi:MAG: bifunctional phosphoribosylaminoimidazolecarboxamide formyltransferase/IMP cyclohydrolase PurH [Bacteroidia bacterium]|nr:MAG: bifunctional phosphoribosylaminoimidazolecarboxamide formyltransferase/IMP cyclohydrolase PurH [Bacteroidia bacterium]
MGSRIATALLSVYDKGGLDGAVAALVEQRVDLLSTGGTYDYLLSRGVQARRVEDLTGYPSILGGRVKTLHPAVFGGILHRRGHQPDLDDLARHGIGPIDLVVVDLYPFEQALAQGAGQEELVEKVDIGGVSLLRAAAKNYRDTLVVSSRAQYPELERILREQRGETTLAQRHHFAAQAFARTAAYDMAIARHFTVSDPLADQTPEPGVRLAAGLAPDAPIHPLRYGENPHQKGYFLGDRDAMFRQLHGKELSYNNLLDLDAGLGLLDEFEAQTVAVLKHGTPCGLACDATLAEAWRRALAGDPQSAFGGVILTNAVVDGETAREMDAIFFEVCLAQGFLPEALNILRRKKNRVLLERGPGRMQTSRTRTALNGVLHQDADRDEDILGARTVASVRQPSPAELADMAFANRIVKHCKSNAIAIARGGQLIGVGAGETSRVDATRHAIEKARAFGHSLQGAVLASDAFFPFADSLELAAEAGVTAVVQPGGSIRDQESIALADARGLAMLLTGIRHFKH